MSAGTDIKTWKDRAYAELGPGYFRFKPDSYMEAEIADLRAALEAKQQALEAEQRAGSAAIVPHVDTACARLDKGSCGCTGYCAGYFNRQAGSAPPAAVQPNPIDGYGGLCIGPDRDGVKQMLYAPMDYMNEISKAIHAWRNKQPDSGRDAALWEAVAAIYFDDSSKYEGALWNIVHRLSPCTWNLLKSNSRAAYNAMAAQQDEARPLPGDKP